MSRVSIIQEVNPYSTMLQYPILFGKSRICFQIYELKALGPHPKIIPAYAGTDSWMYIYELNVHISHTPKRYCTLVEKELFISNNGWSIHKIWWNISFKISWTKGESILNLRYQIIFAMESDNHTTKHYK